MRDGLTFLVMNVVPSVSFPLMGTEKTAWRDIKVDWVSHGPSDSSERVGLTSLGLGMMKTQRIANGRDTIEMNQKI